MCRTAFLWLPVAALSVVLAISPGAAELEPPKITGISVTNSQRLIEFTPYPGAQEFKLFRAEELDQPFRLDNSGTVKGYQWSVPSAGVGSSGFYRLQVNPVSSDALLAATLLHRLAYGPTPDEIERVAAIGPEAYIEEQLNPELIAEELEINKIITTPGWQYITASGLGARSVLYVYLDSAGEGYIDDIVLVRGTVPEVGPNLLRNGNFELPLSTNDWTVSTNLAGSSITTTVKRSGNGALRLVATSQGTTQANSIWQTIRPALAANQPYTLSYWFLPSTNKPATLTVRLSGDSISSPSLLARLNNASGEIDELQSWHILHAVQSKRQLFEVLTQFIDNHFTTFYSKTRQYMDGKVAARIHDELATELEFREIKQWREVLLSPNGTFYDLLKISAESPAMTIYLDSVTSSRGAANENYARELLELFTMGVDNGYDQIDIEEVSRAWTGWRVDKLREDSPFAARVANPNADLGYWRVRFASGNHDTTTKTIFRGKTIDPRFGRPHAGKSYELRLPTRTGNAGMQDGYDIITHLADLPYTQEYISVKLCRLFVHEGFDHGVYDYTSVDLSPEGKLIRDCMAAWDKPAQDGRKGNLRNVLRVIFTSPLFREHTASRQKVKTPFEYTVSVVRALRAAKPDGKFTAESTGLDMLDPMNRIGMRLFFREEPDGWPEAGNEWINTSTLVERMRFAQQFLADSSKTDPVGLLKLKLPTAQWRNAGAVVDYFLSLLFLGEGKANLDLDRTAAIAYLNSNDAGIASSFSNLDPNSATYNNRVRGMVAMLMGLPRFQEQ